MKQSKFMIAFEIVSTVLVVTIAILMMVNKIPKYDKVPDTYGNLVEAIKKDKNAKLKYERCAKLADLEGDTALAKLFMAAADAKDIHINKKYALATEVKPLIMPSSDDFTPYNSTYNLQLCIEEGAYQGDTMYPEFILAAEQEGFKKAKNLFIRSKAVEKAHTDIFNQMLIELREKGQLKDEITVYLCGGCGKLEMHSKSWLCSVCKTPGFMFTKY